MELRKISEGATTITLGWTPNSQYGGYVFFANGQPVSTGSRKLKDGSLRSSVRFHKTSPGPPFHVYAAIPGPNFDVGVYGEDEPEPPPETRRAPRAYNLGTNNSDPRFCVHGQPGVSQIGPDQYRDEGSSDYNGDGFNTGGVWRDRNRMVPGLLPANSMDGRAPCDPYTNGGVTIGGSAGYPAESYLL